MQQGTPLSIALERQQTEGNFSATICQQLLPQFGQSLPMRVTNLGARLIDDHVACPQDSVEKIKIFPCAGWAARP